MLDRFQNNRHEPMRWAIGPDGKHAFIDNVPNGMSCHCTCIKCNQPVMAKNNEVNIKEHHFAHYGDYSNDNNRKCNGKCDDEMIHKMAEQIICQNKCIMLPNYLHYHARVVDFVEVELEQRNDRSDMQPDIVGITKERDRILIEIKNTNPVHHEKLQKIYEDNLICLEIDVSKQNQDTLENFLLRESDSRIWLNNPKYLDKAINDLKVIYPNLEVHNVSFCEKGCTLSYGCYSKKYAKYKVRRENQTIVLCNYADSEDKKRLNKKTITTTAKPKESPSRDYAQIEIPTSQPPQQLDLFDSPIIENTVSYPFEPPKGVPKPLEAYFNRINGKKDSVFQNTKDDKYLIYRVYPHDNNLNVETYGQIKIKQSGVKPFRVYVIKYNVYRRKYVYTYKDFYHENELDAFVYARDYNDNSPSQ